MEPFLLSVADKNDGTTHMTFDVGPTARANVVVFTENAQAALGVPASILLHDLLNTVRLPDRRRAK